MQPLELRPTNSVTGGSTSQTIPGIPISDSGTFFPDSDTLANTFKGCSTVFTTNTPANPASSAELLLHNTLTKRCAFNWRKSEGQEVLALTNNTLATFTAIFSDSFPKLDNETLSKNFLKVPPDQRRIEALKLFDGNYDRYLTTVRNKLKLSACELLLHRVSKEFTQGEEITIQNNANQLLSEVSASKAVEKISSSKRANFSLCKDLLQLAKENEGLIVLLTGNCINLAGSIAQGNLNDHGRKILEVIERNDLETFRNSVLNLQYLNIIDKIQRSPNSDTGKPTLLLTYMDEMSKMFDSEERSFSPKHGLSVENRLIQIVRQTLEDFDKAYEVEVREINTLRAQSLSNTAGAISGRVVTELGNSGTRQLQSNGSPILSTDSSPLTITTQSAAAKASPRGSWSRRSMVVTTALTFTGLALWRAGAFDPSQSPINPAANGGTHVNGGNGVKAVENNGGDKGKKELVDSILELNKETRKFEREINNYPESRDFLGAAQKALSTVKIKSGVVLGKWNNSEDPKELTEGLNALSTDQLGKLKEAFEEFSKAEYTVKIITVLEQENNFSKEYMEKSIAIEKKHKMNGLSADNDKKMFLSGYEANALKAFYTERVALFQPEADFQSLDENQRTMVTELLKLKEEFPTYKEKEDIDQVTAVYKKHKIDPTTVKREDLIKLAKATPEALADVYVESLDASCRVVAKGELEELKKTNPIDKNLPAEELKRNIDKVYLSVLQYYLMPKTSEEFLLKEIDKSIDYIKKHNLDQWLETLENYKKGNVSHEDLVKSLDSVKLGGSSELKYVLFSLVGFKRLEQFTKESKITLPSDISQKDTQKLDSFMQSTYSGIPEDLKTNLNNALRDIFTENEFYDRDNDLYCPYELFGRDLLIFGYSFSPNHEAILNGANSQEIKQRNAICLNKILSRLSKVKIEISKIQDLKIIILGLNRCKIRLEQIVDKINAS
jgi:hypothetical protein